MTQNFTAFSKDYRERLKQAIDLIPDEPLEALANALMRAWAERKQVFIFGNGGSAGNAIHLANDFLYGISRQLGHALRVTALPANSAVLTCLANDEGYDGIFFRQLAVLAEPGDVVIAFSGSGNSPNILRALEYCAEHQIESFAVLGYTGGKAKTLASHAIHVPVNDMQISEDLQLVVGHLMMQWMYAHRNDVKAGRS
ncbi:MAG: SIS domain-containing protein [Betaproteobacteria bacterium]|nr:SIS domain-containing protein [Betaproteobacteria bacterium]